MELSYKPFFKKISSVNFQLDLEQDYSLNMVLISYAFPWRKVFIPYDKINYRLP